MFAIFARAQRKMAQNGPKSTIFQNWQFYSSKNGIHIKQMPILPLWGILALKSGLRFGIRSLKVSILGI